MAACPVCWLPSPTIMVPLEEYVAATPAKSPALNASIILLNPARTAASSAVVGVCALELPDARSTIPTSHANRAIACCFIDASALVWSVWRPTMPVAHARVNYSRGKGRSPRGEAGHVDHKNGNKLAAR